MGPVVTANDQSRGPSQGNSHSASITADFFKMKDPMAPTVTEASIMRESDLSGAKLPTFNTNNKQTESLKLAFS